MASALVLAAGAGAEAVVFTWDGGGGNDLWSNGANWVGDTPPAATGGQLTFSGNTQLVNTNDLITSLVNGSNEFDGTITFAAGAGSFTLNGSVIEWETDSNGQFIANNSGADQTINVGFADVTLGTRDRSINTGGATITLNGDINIGNDRLFANGFAGTIVLNGNNSGDGTSGALVAGTNQFRSTMRNNVPDTQLVLGSNTALGNAGVGTIEAGNAIFKGLVANSQMKISTNTAGLDLSGSTLVVNTGGPIEYNGNFGVTFGYLGNQNGNRNFFVAADGDVTIANGIFYSDGTTARQLAVVVDGGAGNMIVNGKLYDTIDSNGITSQRIGTAGVAVNATARFQGAGTVTLNGDSSATFGGSEVRANGAGTTIVLGHANAMGDATSFVDIDNGSTLDLNGQTISQTFLGLNGSGVGGNGAIINSDAGNPAAITTEILNAGLFTVGGSGDVELQTVRHVALVNRNITKVGTGTLTLSGSVTNDRYGLIVNDGVVNLNKSDIAVAVINNPLVVNGGTVRLTGTSGNQIHDNDPVDLNGGTLDLNGMTEIVDAITIEGLGAGGNGVLINGTAATSAIFIAQNTFTLSGNASMGGDGDLTLTNIIGDGGSGFGLSKVGGGKLFLTAFSSYTGTTSVDAGELNVSGVGSTGFGDTTVAAGATLSGDGLVLGNLSSSGTVAPGNSAGTLTVNGDVGLDVSASLAIEIGGLTAGTFDVLDLSGTATLGGSLDLSLIGGYTPNLGDTFQILSASNRLSLFDSVTGGDIGGGLSFDVLYGATGVTLEVISGGLINGDLNGDGFVGIADLNIVLGAWNQTVPPGDPLADPSGDGFVGIADLNVVLGNWNAGTPPAASAVPEPATLALLGLGGLAMLKRRR